jgi:Zn-dependent peptidase ImmA (M78 family)/DNA-binding XRE family transcriptional regulator
MAFNPVMLVTARNLRQMTQTDLAEKVEVSQGFISQLEGGIETPSDDVLNRIAEALQVSERLLQVSDVIGDVEVVHFRKLKKTPAKSLKLLRSEIQLIQLQLGELLRSVEIPIPNLPSIDLQAWAESFGPEYQYGAEEAAAEVRVAFDVPDGPLLSLAPLLEERGVLILRKSFHDAPIDGVSFLSRVLDGRPVILLRQDASGDRDRLTIAHELAHLVFGHHVTVPPSTAEEEAWSFASAFLMPRDDIRSELRQCKSLGDFLRLKPRWRVSAQALIRRAFDLEIISKSTYTRLSKEVTVRGMRRQEPLPIPSEQLSLVSEIIDFHLGELGYTMWNLSTLLFLRKPAQLVSSGLPFRRLAAVV